VGAENSSHLAVSFAFETPSAASPGHLPPLDGSAPNMASEGAPDDGGVVTESDGDARIPPSLRTALLADVPANARALLAEIHAFPFVQGVCASSQFKRIQTPGDGLCGFTTASKLLNPEQPVPRDGEARRRAADALAALGMKVVSELCGFPDLAAFAAAADTPEQPELSPPADAGSLLLAALAGDGRLRPATPELPWTAAAVWEAAKAALTPTSRDCELNLFYLWAYGGNVNIAALHERATSPGSLFVGASDPGSDGWDHGAFPAREPAAAPTRYLLWDRGAAAGEARVALSGHFTALFHQDDPAFTLLPERQPLPPPPPPPPPPLPPLTDADLATAAAAVLRRRQPDGRELQPAEEALLLRAMSPENGQRFHEALGQASAASGREEETYLKLTVLATTADSDGGQGGSHGGVQGAPTHAQRSLAAAEAFTALPCYNELLVTSSGERLPSLAADLLPPYSPLCRGGFCGFQLWAPASAWSDIARQHGKAQRPGGAAVVMAQATPFTFWIEAAAAAQAAATLPQPQITNDGGYKVWLFNVDASATPSDVAMAATMIAPMAKLREIAPVPFSATCRFTKGIWCLVFAQTAAVRVIGKAINLGGRFVPVVPGLRRLHSTRRCLKCLSSRHHSGGCPVAPAAQYRLRDLPFVPLLSVAHREAGGALRSGPTPFADNAGRGGGGTGGGGVGNGGGGVMRIGLRGLKQAQIRQECVLE